MEASPSMKKVLGSKRNILLFCLPAIILFAAFVVYPIFSLARLSLMKTDGISYSDYVGLGNYAQIFREKIFLRANKRSLYCAAFGFLGIACLGSITAFITSGLRCQIRRIYKTAFLIPFLLSVTVISQLWLTIYNYEWGLLNRLLTVLGLGDSVQLWLGSSKTALPCLMIVGMWWVFGMTVLLVYTSIQSIPASYFEAAQIDGANFWQNTWYISFPLCKNTIKICMITQTIAAFYTFPQVYVMTGGGPGEITTTVMMLIYRETFTNLRYGLSSAMSVLTMIECCLMIACIAFIMKDRGQGKESLQF